MRLLFVGLLATQARAGIVDWCLNRLVPVAPPEYTDFDTAWLVRERARLHVRIVWHRATAADLAEAERITTELERRHITEEDDLAQAQ